MKLFASLAMLATVSADVVVTTKSYPGENTFEILNAAGEVVCKGGPFDDRKEYPQPSCSLTDKTYTIKCIDSYGDGWHGGFISLGSEKYCEDFRRGHL